MRSHYRHRHVWGRSGHRRQRRLRRSVADVDLILASACTAAIALPLAMRKPGCTLTASQAHPGSYPAQRRLAALTRRRQSRILWSRARRMRRRRTSRRRMRRRCRRSRRSRTTVASVGRAARIPRSLKRCALPRTSPQFRRVGRLFRLEHRRLNGAQVAVRNGPSWRKICRAFWAAIAKPPTRRPMLPMPRPMHQQQPASSVRVQLWFFKVATWPLPANSGRSQTSVRQRPVLGWRAAAKPRIRRIRIWLLVLCAVRTMYLRQSVATAVVMPRTWSVCGSAAG